MKFSFSLFCVSSLAFVCSCMSPNRMQNTQVNRNVDSSKTNIYIVDYDFRSGTFKSNNLKLKVNQPVSLKVSNVNRIAYDINISAKDSILAQTYFFDSPSDFFSLSKLLLSGLKGAATITEITPPKMTGKDATTINTNDVADTSAAEKKKIVEQIVKITTIEAQKQRLTEEIINLQSDSTKATNDIKKYDTFVNAYNELQKKIDSLKNDTLQIEASKEDLKKLDAAKNSISINEVNKGLEQTKIAIKNRTDELKALTNFSDNTRNALVKFNADNNTFNAAFANLKNSYNESVSATNCCKRIAEIANSPELTYQSFCSMYRYECDSIKTTLRDLKQTIIKFQQYYRDVELTYNYLKYNPEMDAILNYGGQVKLYAYADYLKTYADKMNDNVKEIDFSDLITKAQRAIDFLKTENAFNVISAPVQPFNDVVVFDVNITKKEKNSNDFYSNKSFKHREFTYGGTRLDFSLGLAGSYFPNTPVYELSVKDTSEGSTIKIQQTDNKLYVPALVGMVTMSYRKSGYVTFGVSAGLGIDVNDGQISLRNFIAGPSAIFGKYDRLTLTAGGSIRNVGKLKSGYEVGQVVSGTADDINNFLTTNYKLGMFLSLTYNLTKGVKDAIKKF